jgi:hypothetical protein
MVPLTMQIPEAAMKAKNEFLKIEPHRRVGSSTRIS